MRRLLRAARRGSVVVAAAGVLAVGCAPPQGDTDRRGTGGGNPGPGRGQPSGGGGAPSTPGSGGSPRTGGVSGAGGAQSASGGVSGTGGRVPSTGGAGGASAGTGGRAAGAGGSGGAFGGTTGTGGSSVPSSCVLPATVRFQTDVQPFLITACGDGNGCHVIDGVSTVASGGFNHAYDWVTAGAHAASCPETPTPKRFEVAIAVINGANPPTCSRSRKMPPPDATGADLRMPLSPCQIATLQAWLDEPLVTQVHRADDSSPTTPYPMPPFN